MSISFAGFPTVQYIGAVYSEPMQIASGRTAGRAVPLTFNWAAYGVGAGLPAINVNVNLQANSGQAAPLLDRIRSIYIDNTGNNYPVYVQFPDTGFVVAAQAYSAGWYPVFSNAFILNVAVTGFDNQNNLTELNIFVTNVLASPYTDIAFQSFLPLQLASPDIGGGASVTSVFATGGLPAGSNYNNGNLSVSGGGGFDDTDHRPERCHYRHQQFLRCFRCNGFQRNRSLRRVVSGHPRYRRWDSHYIDLNDIWPVGQRHRNTDNRFGCLRHRHQWCGRFRFDQSKRPDHHRFGDNDKLHDFMVGDTVTGPEILPVLPDERDRCGSGDDGGLFSSAFD